MKVIKCIFFVVYLFASLLFASPGVSEEYISRFWNVEEDCPSEVFAEILYTQGLPTTLSLNDLIFLTQKLWRRGQEKELWELGEESAWEKNQREVLMPYFDQLGLLCKILPPKKQYEAVLLFGARAERVVARLTHLLSLELEATHLYLLGGARPLIQKELIYLAEQFQITGVRTEAEMMMAIASLMVEDITYSLVNVPMKLAGARPTTADTLWQWLQDHGELEGSFLLVSNQPYAICQYLVAQLVVKRHLREDISFDLTAPSGGKSTLLKVHLDNLARLFFSIQQLVIWEQHPKKEIEDRSFLFKEPFSLS